MKLLIVSFLLLAACAPTIQYAATSPTGDRPPRAVAEVEVLSLRPACAFTEIGMLEADSHGADFAQTVQRMREEGARRGADAILLTGHQAAPHHGTIQAGDHDYFASAIVLSPQCAPASAAVVR
jgi:hypothetical protein